MSGTFRGEAAMQRVWQIKQRVMHMRPVNVLGMCSSADDILQPIGPTTQNTALHQIPRVGVHTMGQ